LNQDRVDYPSFGETFTIQVPFVKFPHQHLQFFNLILVFLLKSNYLMGMKKG